MLELIGACVWMVFMSLFGCFGQNAPEAPADPVSRARHFVAHCMTLLKSELYGAEIVELEPERVVYRPAAHQTARVLTFQGGLVLRDGQRISELGPNGSLAFEQVSPSQIRIEIASEVSAQARHRASVHLSVNQLA